MTTLYQAARASARRNAVLHGCMVLLGLCALLLGTVAVHAANFTVSLNGPISGTAGQALTVSGTITPLSNVALSDVTLEFGDGTTVPLASATGPFSVSKTYATAGSYALRLSAKDKAELSYQATTTANIAAASVARSGTLTATPNPISVAAGVGIGSTTLRYTSNVSRIQLFRGPLANLRVIRTDDLTSRDGSITLTDVANNEIFFLQDASQGTSQATANTLAQVTISVVANAAPVGTGLRGHYFEGIDFRTRRFSRIDPTIDFNFGLGAPAAPAGATAPANDQFSIRWTGQIVPRSAGTYTFFETSDDGVRLTIDGVRVIDRLLSEGPATEQSGTFTVTEANRPLPVSIEYFDDVGDASIRFEWQGPGFAREVVPATQLLAAPEIAASFSTPTPTLSVVSGTTQNVTLQWNTQPLGAVTSVEIRRNAPNGPLVASGGATSGAGGVVTQIGGTSTFYLQDRSDPASVTRGFSTLAVLTVRVLATDIPTVAISTATNRVSAARAGVQLIAYDKAGNVTLDRLTGVGARSFDAENRLIAADGSDHQLHRFRYDGAGKRTHRDVGLSSETWFVYGIDGELLAEYSAGAAASEPNVEYAYRNGDLLAQARGLDLRYLIKDHLGSTRMTVDKSGAFASVRRSDYMPYGEELLAGDSGRTPAQGYGGPGEPGKPRQRFTGYEREDDIDVDFAQARYYSAAMGRFLSVDPLNSSASVVDPQTWNRYAYSLNSPLVFIDENGLKPKKRGISDSKLKLFSQASNLVEDLNNKIRQINVESAREEVKTGVNLLKVSTYLDLVGNAVMLTVGLPQFEETALKNAVFDFQSNLRKLGNSCIADPECNSDPQSLEFLVNLGVLSLDTANGLLKRARKKPLPSSTFFNRPFQIVIDSVRDIDIRFNLNTVGRNNFSPDIFARDVLFAGGTIRINNGFGFAARAPTQLPPIFSFATILTLGGGGGGGGLCFSLDCANFSTKKTL